MVFPLFLCSWEGPQGCTLNDGSLPASLVPCTSFNFCTEQRIFICWRMIFYNSLTILYVHTRYMPPPQFSSHSPWPSNFPFWPPCLSPFSLYDFLKPVSVTNTCLVWGHPLNLGKPTKTLPTKRRDPPSLTSHQMATSPQLEVEPLNPLFHPCLNVDWLSLNQVLCQCFVLRAATSILCLGISI